MTNSRVTAIDLLKLMGCVAVVGLHTLNKDVSNYNAFLYFACGFAVPIFFATSGFFLLNRGKVTYKYTFDKICGIVRLVMLWNIIFWVYNIAKTFFKNEITFKDLFYPIEIIKFFLQKGNCWHFWYLGALILVYFCLPKLSRISEKKKSDFTILLFTICMCIQMISIYVGYPIQAKVIQTFRIWTWLLYFLIGGYMSRANESISKYLSVNLHGVLMVFISLFIIIYQMYIGSNIITYIGKPNIMMNAEYFYDSIFTVAWIIILFTFILRININKKIINIIEILSKFTIGVYCIHPLFVNVLSCFLVIDSFFEAILYWGLVLFLSFLTSLIISKSRIGKYILKI